jgi:hypothetical protein
VCCEVPTVEEDVHDHDRDEFAGLAEDHGGVRYIRQCSKAQRCRRCDKDRTMQITQK